MSARTGLVALLLGGVLLLGGCGGDFAEECHGIEDGTSLEDALSSIGEDSYDLSAYGVTFKSSDGASCYCSRTGSNILSDCRYRAP